MKEPITEKIYACTGISQQDLAALAGVHTSTLNRFESHTRDLPAPALIVIGLMYDALVKMPPPAPAVPAAAAIETIKKMAKACAAEAYMLEQKLEATVQGYRQGAGMLQWLEIYKAKTPPPYTAKQQRWLETQEYEATLKIEKNNWLLQQKMTVKLEILRLEAEKYAEIAANA